ncbi:MAG: protein translocase subunit SecF, partial [Deefgea sp.]
MEFFHVKRDIPFMSYGKLTTAISLLTFVLSVFFLVAKGLNFGIEFTGGTVMELRYQKPADLNQIRTRVDSLKLGETQVQSMGTTVDVMLRIPNIKDKNSAQLSNTVLEALKQDRSDVELRKVEFIGPSVGDELFTHGLTALALVCVGIIAYLAMRFEWRFAVSAVIANMHDVVIILGCFALFQWEFNL